MRWVRQLRNRLRALFKDRQLDEELDEELRYHLDRQIEQHLRAGMLAADARRAALREFGGLDQRREECRDARGVALVETVIQDARYAARSLTKTPGFTTVAVLSLALGIGANTTIFTFVQAVLLTPLPYPDSGRLVVLHERPLASTETVNVHPLNFTEWKARSNAFDALALVQTIPINVMTAAGAERAVESQVTSEIFAAFGERPLLGRGFTADETRPGDHPLAVLGYSFWQRQFGGDPGVLGRSLQTGDGPLQIVGVAPAGLRLGSFEPDLYTPLPIDSANPSAIGSRSFQCYGRLRSDVDVGRAQAELDGIAARLADEYPLDKGYGVAVSTLHDDLVHEARPALRLLTAVVVAVLLIACVNVAGLLMARGVGRRGELAVRASLGATRGRLVRQLLIESLLLAAAGGALGLVFTEVATRVLITLTAGALQWGIDAPIAVNATCLAFTVGVSLGAAAGFGTLPAWRAGRAEPQSALASRGRGATTDRRDHRLRSVLVVSEIGTALVLMVGAGLLLQTFIGLTRLELGFQPARTITMNLFLGDRPDDVRIGLVDRLVDAVEALPGVTAAGTVQFLPLSGMTCGTGVWVEGRAASTPSTMIGPPGDPSRGLPTDCFLVGGDYFAAMGIPLLRGRVFSGDDRRQTRRVVVINRTFADTYLRGADAVGRTVTVAWSDTAPAEVVGVVGDVRHDALTSRPAPTVYMLHAQVPGYITNLVVRSAVDPATQVPAIRTAIRGVDRTQAIANVRTMGEYVEQSLARPRLYAALVTGFSVLALLLAAFGVYGLIAFVVSQRTHEIGIRMALGAGRGQVFGAVLRQALILAAAGLAAGGLAAVVGARLMSSLLFGVTPGDPATFAVAVAIFVAAAFGAAAVPAWRAARIDPTRALRYE